MQEQFLLLMLYIVLLCTGVTIILKTKMDIRMPLLICLIFFIVLSVGFIWTSILITDSYGGCDIYLFSDKKNYKIGENIILTVRIKNVLGKKTYIRFFKRKLINRNIMFNCYARGINKHEEREYLFSKYIVDLKNKKQEVERIRLFSNEYIEYKFICKTSKTGRKDKKFYFLINDYEKYEFNTLGYFQVSTILIPIKPHILDSLEYYSNSIYIKIKK